MSDRVDLCYMSLVVDVVERNWDGACMVPVGLNRVSDQVIRGKGGRKALMQGLSTDPSSYILGLQRTLSVSSNDCWDCGQSFSYSNYF